MSGERHTPGPWQVDDEMPPNTAGVFVRVHGDPFGHDMGIPIAAPILTPAYRASAGERRANARLIAAAPDLLAALQELLKHAGIADADPSDIDGEDHVRESRARAAIKKATGHE